MRLARTFLLWKLRSPLRPGAGGSFHLIALRKNRYAALRSSLAVSRKSAVTPALSTDCALKTPDPTTEHI
jgi:hypothetical protein